LRKELHPKGVEIVTICLDSIGVEAARPYVERAQPEHPSLIDVAHVVDERFGVVNIPNSVWIDEAGMIVRPAEPAWPGAPDAANADEGSAPPTPPEDPSGRLAEMMEAASEIVHDGPTYVAALRDWAERGAASEFALSPDEVIGRSGRRGMEEATAAAEFELAQHLFRAGDLDSARAHFREAHGLQPDNWTYKRQAWSIEPSAFEGPLERFWQGPLPGKEADWAYDGDWVRDAKAAGPANYYPRFRS
jgi:hypothetical protein